MPAGPSHSGVVSALRVPLLLRAVILSLHWHAGMTFKTIGEILEVNAGTASWIVLKAKVFHSLKAVIENKF